MSMGGGGQTVNTVQQADPWKGVQPYLTDMFSRANYLSNRGWTPAAQTGAPMPAAAPAQSQPVFMSFGPEGEPKYELADGTRVPGPNFAPPTQGGPQSPGEFTDVNAVLAQQSPYTLQAQQAMVQRAQDPNSLIGRSQSQLSSTIAGNYLSPETNPFFKSAVEDALGLAGSAFAKQYGGAAGGNLGNSGYQEGLTRTLGQLATNAYAGEYGRERQNQLNALQLAPAFQNADIGQLAQVGALEEARRQAELDAPFNQLRQYQGLISGQPGGTTSGQQPYFSNPLANALGLGLGGVGLYNGLGAAGLFGGGSAGLTGLGGSTLGSAGMSDLAMLALMA